MNSTTIPPSVDLAALEMVLLGIGSILLIVSFFCFVLVLVKMFQHKEFAVGTITFVSFAIIGLGQLVALIFGWMKADDWKIRMLMTVYTATLIGGLLFGGVGYGIFLAKAINATVGPAGNIRPVPQANPKVAPGLEIAPGAAQQ